MDYLVLVGATAIVAGVLLILLSTVRTNSREEGNRPSTEVKGGGVVMIGPIPIVFGSDARWAILAMILAIALIILSLLLSVRAQ